MIAGAERGKSCCLLALALLWSDIVRVLGFLFSIFLHPLPGMGKALGCLEAGIVHTIARHTKLRQKKSKILEYLCISLRACVSAVSGDRVGFPSPVMLDTGSSLWVYPFSISSHKTTQHNSTKQSWYESLIPGLVAKEKVTSALG